MFSCFEKTTYIYIYGDSTSFGWNMSRKKYNQGWLGFVLCSMLEIWGPREDLMRHMNNHHNPEVFLAAYRLQYFKIINAGKPVILETCHPLLNSNLDLWHCQPGIHHKMWLLLILHHWMSQTYGIKSCILISVFLLLANQSDTITKIWYLPFVKPLPILL